MISLEEVTLIPGGGRTEEHVIAARILSSESDFFVGAMEIHCEEDMMDDDGVSLFQIRDLPMYLLTLLVLIANLKLRLVATSKKRMAKN